MATKRVPEPLIKRGSVVHVVEESFSSHNFSIVVSDIVDGRPSLVIICRLTEGRGGGGSSGKPLE